MTSIRTGAAVVGAVAILALGRQAVYAGPLEGPYEVLVDGMESPAEVVIHPLK